MLFRFVRAARRFPLALPLVAGCAPRALPPAVAPLPPPPPAAVPRAPEAVVLAACAAPPAPTEPTTAILLLEGDVEIRIPGAFREEPLTQPSDGPLPRRWTSADAASVLLLVGDRSRQPGFGLLQYDVLGRTLCQTPIAGATARVFQYAAVRAVAPFDTLYVANVDAELQPEKILFAAVIARSAARRDALLGAVRRLRAAPAPRDP